MTRFRLGGSRAKTLREETLRGGALAFASPYGLRVETALSIEALPKKPPGSALFALDTEGAATLAARALWPASGVVGFHLDAYVAERAADTLRRNGVADVPTSAAADLPAGPFDLVVLPFPKGAEKQLVWDVLEAAHDALRPGGRAVVATEGASDALRAAIKKVFRNVTPAAPVATTRRRRGACFYAERRRASTASSPRAHVLTPVFAHDDGSSTSLEVETRPGTFSYGRLDRGTRALAEGLVVGDADSVIDLGAGCGTLGISAALRLPAADVVLVDSNARAVACAQRNAARNGVGERVTAIVRADLDDLPTPPGGFALALANPPYFSGYRIARSFVRSASRVLRPGGRLWVVVRLGRTADSHAEILDEEFGAHEAVERGGYALLTATAT